MKRCCAHDYYRNISKEHLSIKLEVRFLGRSVVYLGLEPLALGDGEGHGGGLLALGSVARLELKTELGSGLEDLTHRADGAALEGVEGDRPAWDREKAFVGEHVVGGRRDREHVVGR